MPKANYDLYINLPVTGMMLMGECAVMESGRIVEAVGFRYAEDYLQSEQAIALDPVQLPLSSQEFALHCDRGIPGFLDDYLPDDWGRRVLAKKAYYKQRKKYDANSVIDTLSLIGESRIGAISIVEKQQTPNYAAGAPLAELNRAEAAAQAIDQGELSQLPDDEMALIYLANSGTGVGGARPKALVSDHGRHYLAKFNRQQQDGYNNARVELACARMAHQAGIDIKVENSRVVSGINGREALLLERFDILPDGSRAHLITINALLKDPQTQRDHGGAFLYDQIHRILTEHSINITQDAEQLLRRMLFNRAINNTDDHERNFSLINSGEGYQLSPAYDMVPTLSHGQYHAAGYGYSTNPPSPAELEDKVRYFGLPKPFVRRCAEQVVTAIEQWPEIAKEVGVEESQAEKIARYFHR